MNVVNVHSLASRKCCECALASSECWQSSSQRNRVGPRGHSCSRGLECLSPNNPVLASFWPLPLAWPGCVPIPDDSGASWTAEISHTQCFTWENSTDSATRRPFRPDRCGQINKPVRTRTAPTALSIQRPIRDQRGPESNPSRSSPIHQTVFATRASCLSFSRRCKWRPLYLGV